MNTMLVVSFLFLLCVGVGVTRLFLKRYSPGPSIFLGAAAAATLAYLLGLGLFTRQLTVHTDSEEHVDPEVVATSVDVPRETPLIDLSLEGKEKSSKPGWVESEPVLEGDLYKISVVSDPKLTVLEAQADLEQKVFAATKKYMTDLLDASAAQAIKVDRDFINERIQKEVYLEPVSLPVGDMQMAHALLVFDTGVRDEFRSQFRVAEVRWRMVQAGGLGVLVLGVIGMVFGFLRLDTLTRGYYTGRLQLTAAALILAVAWAGYELMGTSRW